jgi:hypothetical protein
MTKCNLVCFYRRFGIIFSLIFSSLHLTKEAAHAFEISVQIYHPTLCPTAQDHGQNLYRCPQIHFCSKLKNLNAVVGNERRKESFSKVLRNAVCPIVALTSQPQPNLTPTYVTREGQLYPPGHIQELYIGSLASFFTQKCEFMQMSDRQRAKTPIYLHKPKTFELRALNFWVLANSHMNLFDGLNVEIRCNMKGVIWEKYPVR